MKVLVTGSTGMVGTELIVQLRRKGYDVVRLVRHKGNFDEPQIGWDPAKGHLNPADLQGIDAVVHLAGENIAGGPWTEERKARIVNSRVQGTRLLAETLAKMDNPPKTLISASAVGYYGSRGDEVLNEVSSHGKGFLSKTCREWEAAAQPAIDKGIRVAFTRFGVILSPQGGALKAMKCPFKMGLAGNLGNGKQYFSWVALDDVVGALIFLLEHPEIRGPINVVAPQDTTNAQFTDAMRKTLIPSFLPMHYWTPPAPAIAVRLLLGEMGDQLLLASQRVRPVRLLENGYEFKHKTIRETLDAIL